MSELSALSIKIFKDINVALGYEAPVSLVHTSPEFVKYAKYKTK